MTQSEKIYFRKFASIQIGKDTGTHSIKLFNYMSSHKNNSDEECKKHFKGNYIERFLPQVKSYLTQQILKSLVNFHSAGLPANQYYHQYSELEICIEKGLFDYAEKKIEKCKKRSDWRRNTRFTLEIIRWQKTIMALKGFSGYTQAEIDEWRELEYQMMAELQSETKLAYPYFETFSIIKNQGGLSQEQMLIALENAVSIAGEINIENVSGYNLKAYYLNIFANYFYIKSNWEKELHYRKEFFKLIVEEYKLFTNNHQAGYQNHYVTALNNLIMCCLKCGLEEESAKYLKMLESSIQGLSSEYTALLTRPYLFTMKISRQKADYDSMIRSGESLLLKFPDPETTNDNAGYLLMYLYMATAYYMKDQKSKTLHMLNKIMNSPAIGREDVKFYARIFRLYSHIFTKDYDFVVSEIRSIQRTELFLKASGLPGKKILELAKKLSQSKLPGKQADLLEEYIEQLNVMQDEKPYQNMFEIFDLMLILKKNLRSRNG